jgi:AcrR family transcriptional regulator
VPVGHRDALLSAARQLVRDKGFAHTTARDLVAASNTNLASIGYHFGSKEKLLHLAMEAEFAEWVEHIGAIALAGDGTPLQRMAVAWAAARDTFAQHRALLVSYVEASAQAERSADVRAQLAGHLAAARRRVAEMVLATLVDASVVEREQAHAVASFLIAVCDGLALQWLLDPDAVPSGAGITTALASVMDGWPVGPATRPAPPDPAAPST